MTRRTGAPVLADPGHGRRWQVERLPHPIHPRRRGPWAAGLLSRTGTVLGYVAEYDNGWGANVANRGRGGRAFRPLPGSWGTAQAAADALLAALRGGGKGGAR